MLESSAAAARPRATGSVLQRKIGLEFEMHIFPVDKLTGSKEEIASLPDGELTRQGQVEDKTDIAETDDYRLTVDTTSGTLLEKGPWNTRSFIFCRAASNAILEIVMKPAETAEEVQMKVRACMKLAQQLYDSTDGLTKRIPYGEYFIGPINNELSDLNEGARRTALERSGKWGPFLEDRGDEETLLTDAGFRSLKPEGMGLSTRASVQVNMGLSMRHLADVVDWYGKEYIYGGKVPAESDPLNYRALYDAPGLARQATARFKAFLIENVKPRNALGIDPKALELSGIEGMTTLLFLYLIGAVETVDASKMGYGTEKNFTHLLSKSAGFEAVGRNFTTAEFAVWSNYTTVLKAIMLELLNVYLPGIRSAHTPMKGTDRVINWHWDSPERPEQRTSPEYWDEHEQKSFVNVTIDELFHDTTSGKDRLLMRLYQIPTANPSTYSGKGPIPMDSDPRRKLQLSVMEFRKIPGLHDIDRWLPIAMQFFDMGKRIHARKKP